MRDRGIGAVVGLSVAAAIWALARLQAGWIFAFALLALAGWAFGGYIRHLRRLAERDELTGVANRRPFERTLLHEWRRAVRYGRPLSLLFIDVDDFGAINKRFGHLMGDEALKAISRLLRQSTRNTDVVARWGGEEFVVLLPETDLGSALILAERIRAVVAQAAVVERDNSVSVTISTGVAGLPGSATSAADLLRRAIAAEAGAKRQKNAVQCAS